MHPDIELNVCICWNTSCTTLFCNLKLSLEGKSSKYQTKLSRNQLCSKLPENIMWYHCWPGLAAVEYQGKDFQWQSQWFIGIWPAKPSEIDVTFMGNIGNTWDLGIPGLALDCLGADHSHSARWTRWTWAAHTFVDVCVLLFCFIDFVPWR